MKVKYKVSPIWLSMAGLWVAITIFLYFKYMPNTEPEYFAPRFFSLVIMPLAVAIYYFLMPKISYLTLDDEKISIHRNAVIIRTNIKRDDLDCCRVERNDLEFYTKKGKSHAIHLDWTNRDEAIGLITKLQSFTQVYDGGTNRQVNLNDITPLK